MNQGLVYFSMSLVIVTQPAARETLLRPALTHTPALLLAIVTRLLSGETLPMADFAALAIVTPHLWIVSLLPADDPAAGDHASATPQLACVLVGNTADDGDPMSPQCFTARGIP